ncbi:phosphonoacetaldehyde reductase [Bacillus sp. FJAT-50079]|uniref:phosphonoacetaldehyde reductase n=1 Tax=Bacillus sp. FJAT-50079 TaxID=2833577 RepID=UPI001BC92EC6|nr:phosphonoacetaldehyde reductase [Bacillus sp. FJAT-50079]MBS4208298.1 phosphonoacetaldehyde reductase [Bacillus sp. FJAT-50079]
MDIKPFCNTEIIFTNKYELEQLLVSYRLSNIVLVMSHSSSMRWEFEEFNEKLKRNCNELNGSFTWIKEVDANPTQRSIISSLQQIGNKKIDVIIAFGGGSAIDLAKGISAFYNSNRNYNYTVKEITMNIKNKSYVDDEFIDIIAVPSTAGTGSELTQWATIWDENKLEKFSIDAPGLRPKKAMIVPELTLTVPKKMTLATGLDAMCQAIESYWSKHTNPIVQDIAYRAVELVIQNLRKSLYNPNDIASREKLCRASVLSGLAFSQTRTTACHSISYPLTMLYGIPHGLAVSLTLDAVSHINRGHFPNDKELLSLFNEYDGIKNWIDMVSDGIVEMKLSAFGITESDIPIIVDNAFTGGRMDNNPVELCKNDVKKILESIM